MGLRFAFPSADQMYAPVETLLQWNIEDDRYYGVSEPDREFLRNVKLETGKIYSILPGLRGSERNKVLKGYDSCPMLTQRSWYRTFVMDKKGARRITPEEYMSMQGDRGTKFPSQMSHSKIWGAMSCAGIYGVEEKIASSMRQIIEGDSLQESIAGYLLREFDDKKFLYSKKAGMVCMPTGTGYTETVKYLVQGIIKRTYGKWKIIVLETSQMLCRQMEQILRDSGFTVRISSSLQDTNDFLTDVTDILIATYVGWENYISYFIPEEFIRIWFWLVCTRKAAGDI